MGKNTFQAKQWIDKCYPDSAPSRQMVEKWFADFNSGRTNTDGVERSGRQHSAVLENIKKVHKMILADRKLKLHDSERCLEIFQRNKKDFFMRYVAMDET